MSFRVKKVSIIENATEGCVALPLNHYVFTYKIPGPIGRMITTLRNPGFKMIIQKITEGDDIKMELNNEKDNTEGIAGVELLVRIKVPKGTSVNDSFSRFQLFLSHLMRKGEIINWSLDHHVPIFPEDTYHLHGTDRFFPDILHQVRSIFFQKRKEYGDSYITAGADWMRQRLREEINEWEMCVADSVDEGHPDYLEVRELMDVVNMCLMLIEILQKEARVGKTLQEQCDDLMKEYGEGLTKEEQAEDFLKGSDDDDKSKEKRS